MARLLDKTFLSEDEGWNLPSDLAGKVERLLEALKLDSYNHRYVLHVTLDAVDDDPPDLADADNGEEQ